MDDPVRPEAIASVAAAHAAGMRVLMLTADHVDTAQTIGHQLGLGGGHAAALEGSALEHLTDAELDKDDPEMSTSTRALRPSTSCDRAAAQGSRRDRRGHRRRLERCASGQMVVFQFFHVFNCRSLDRSIVSIPLLSNRFLFASIVAAAAAHAAVLHLQPLQNLFRTMPLTATEWLVVLLVGSTAIIGGELDKWRNRRRGRLLN